MDDHRYKAFISYSHADERWAQWLHRSLEAYRVPARIVESHGLSSNRLIPIFRDRDELSSSSDLSGVIRQALAESENLIVVCSAESAGSRWVNEEIKAFKQLGKADRIYCLLIDEPDVSFPPAIRLDVDRDGNEQPADSEPLAADARSDADGKWGAKLKLISGLLGIGLDELRQRETRRRYQRMAILAGGSLAVAAFAIVMAGIALVNAIEADRQRSTAEREAETARQVAGFLVELFQSSDPYSEPDSDLSARDILERGAERLERGLTDQPLIRAELLATIGEAFDSLAVDDRSTEMRRLALELRKEHLGRHPKTAESMLDLAASLDDLGEEAEAERLFREGNDLMTDIGAENAALAAGYNNLSLLLSITGRSEEAEELLRRAITLNEKLEGQEAELAVNLNNLAFLVDKEGRIDEVERLFRRSVSIAREIDPSNPATANSIGNLAGVLGELGKLDEAEQLHREAYAIRQRAFGDRQHWELTLSMLGLAEVLKARGDYQEARLLLNDCMELRQQLLGPEHPRIIPVLHHKADLERRLGKLEAAEAIYQQALGLARRLVSEDSEFFAMILQGYVLTMLDEGKGVEAGELAKAAAEIYRSRYPADHWRVARAESLLGAQLVASGERERGSLLLESSCAVLERSLGTSAPATRQCHEWQAR